VAGLLAGVFPHIFLLVVDTTLSEDDKNIIECAVRIRDYEMSDNGTGIGDEEVRPVQGNLNVTKIYTN